jgi:transcription-repair coupling factor (superfamily II helicase)
VIRRADLFATAGRITVSGVPEGYDALLLARLAAEAGPPVLHVARDEPRMMATVEAVRFLAPSLEILPFPAWDCLPYDRASPNVRAVSRRIETLVRLGQPADAGRRLVVTTVNALLQRVPPRSFFADALLSAAVGGDLPDDRVTGFLARNGYRRVGTVREAGEYAVRGGILDLFPPGAELPIRIDRFGDQIEAMRAFDPLTQRSTGDIPSIALMPVSEVRLDEETIERFRTGYRDRFGAVSDDDLLYSAISEGRPYAGMEHWLPLFHGGLETLFDHLPADCPVTFDHQADEAVAARFGTIQDYYETRRSMMGAATGGAPYRPLPPELLYPTEDEWSEQLADRALAHMTPFRAPGTPGRRERLRTVLAEHGITAAEPVERWQKAISLAPGRTALLVLPIEAGFTDDKLSVVTEQDVLGDRLARSTRRRRNFDQFVAEVSALTIGDFVVHVDHGIGRYDGLVAIDVGGAAHDCLRVIYDGGDKLFLPVENIELLSRYGSGDGEVALDKLGGAGWQARKARVKQRIRAIADELDRVWPPPARCGPARSCRRPRACSTSSAPASPSPRPRTSSAPSPTCSRTSVRAGRWTGWSAATSASARPRWRCAPPSSPPWAGPRSRCRADDAARPPALPHLPARFAGLPVGRAAVAPGDAEERQGGEGRLADGQVDIVVGTHALLART